MRGLKGLFGFFTVLILTTHSPELEACARALMMIENASVASKLKLYAGSDFRSVPRLNTHPLHLSSTMHYPFIWITDPHSGSEYAVVRKSDQGFGYGRAQHSAFNLIEEPGASLRSLDIFSGGQPLALASFVVTTEGKQNLVLKLARIKNMDTGEVELVDEIPGLSVEGLKTLGAEYVVTTRHTDNEFFITDTSRNIQVIGLAEDGQLMQSGTLTLPQFVEYDSKAVELDSILKMEFFDDSSSGYLKVKLSDSRVLLVPFAFVYEEPEQNTAAEFIEKAGTTQALQLSEESGEDFEVYFDSAVEISKGAIRTTAFREKNSVFVSYPDRIEAFYFGEDLSSVNKLNELRLEDIPGATQILGMDLYIHADEKLIAGEDGQVKKMIYNAEVRPVLLVKTADDDATHLIWSKLGPQNDIQ